MQRSYQLQIPGQVCAGQGSIAQLSAWVSEAGCPPVTLLTDRGVQASGTAGRVAELLQKAGAEVMVVDDVPTEPEDNQVLAIYSRVKAWKTGMLVAVGGGSVMDTAKMVAVLLQNPEYQQNLTAKELIRAPGIPTVMVPTSAGTGSEATPNSIVVIPEKKLKVGVVHPAFLPQRVILDPELTRTLPPAVTAATGLDAFCHCIETFISKKSNPFCEVFSLKGLSLISRYLRRAYYDGNDLEAREGMLLAAFYGGVAISTSSTVAVHALSYPLGGSYRIAHGVSNAILLPYVMEYNLDAILPQIPPIARAMGLSVDGKTSEQLGEEVMEEIYRLVRELSIPSSLTPYGISSNDLEFLTQAASEVHRLLDQNPKPMAKEDIRAIYQKLV